MIIEVRPGLEVSVVGPPREAGPMAGFFYFAFSGEESLHLDPYNQPIQPLDGEPVRSYSITLPYHGEGFRKEEAMERWAKDLATGGHQLLALFDEIDEAIHYLIASGWLVEKKIAVGGLSRGGWVASHVAARNPHVCALLGFAPLTLASQLDPGSAHLDLHHLCDQLTETQVRFYIGNRDLRVSTDSAFAFIRKLADCGYDAGHRSPRAELIITPSVGHKGHGTPKTSFYGGGRWLLRHLL